VNDEFVWTPPGVATAELEDFLTLRRGLPENANESIHRWLVSGAGDSEFIRWSFMLEFQQAARVNLGLLAVDLVNVRDAFKIFRKFNETQRTWLVDFLLARIPVPRTGTEPERVATIRKTLRDCGSSWTVRIVQNRFRLVETLQRLKCQGLAMVVCPRVRVRFG